MAADCPSSPSYKPSSPSYRPKTPPYNDGRSPPQDSEYDPNEPQLIKSESDVKRDSIDKTCFKLVGDPFQPLNLYDIARPIVSKPVKCNLCSDNLSVRCYLPAFLLRQKNEPPIPKDLASDKDPLFWTQGYCFQCRYTFATKFFVPRDAFPYCTLQRYPPPAHPHGIKYSNGLPASATSVDLTLCEFKEVRRGNGQRNRHRSRSPPRREQDRYHDRDRERDRDSRSDHRNDRGRDYRNEHGRDYYQSDPFRDHRQAQQTQYYSQSTPSQYGQHGDRTSMQYSYGSRMVPPSQSYQQYVPSVNAPIPSPTYQR